MKPGSLPLCQQLGMMGTSVLYSSGDDGIAGGGDQPEVGGMKFSLSFPVMCPFMTAVGATQINPRSTVNNPEGSYEQMIFSGGGFSNYFLANYVVVDGNFTLVFGTSTSSPIVGSLIILVNNACITAGKGPVGFINPAIYSDAFSAVFNNIMMGDNQECSNVVGKTSPFRRARFRHW
ncbi:peptidase S8/S53 domain-containing protein [Cyathus striatus]|nr:peptidase S8/S53 domain-containing protein [Cyathus striatus]